MAKDIKFKGEARGGLKAGVDALANAVKVARLVVDDGEQIPVRSNVAQTLRESNGTTFRGRSRWTRGARSLTFKRLIRGHSA